MADCEWKNWNGISHYPDNSFDLFRIFLRFEYALKNSPDFRRSDADSRVSPDWDAYANWLGHEFFKIVQQSLPESVLITQPPKSQILCDGKLDFVPVQSPKNVQDLFGAIKRVRNNLFHGGKSGSPDRDRDDKLIEDAICVLMLAYKNSAEDLQSDISGNA